MIARKIVPQERKRMLEDYVVTGHWETQTVVDSAATSSARESCRNGWQATIDNLNTELKNCNTQIRKLNSLNTEIEEKMGTISELEGQFNSVQGVVSNANIDFNIIEGNVACMQRINGELTKMKSNCANQLKEWEQKKTDTKNALRDARLQKAECANIVKYKTISVYVA